jgi:hypothetical protein
MSGLVAPPEVPDAVSRRLHPAAIGVAVGTVAMTAGTFAPWLASGASARNLYSSAGLVQRLAGLGRPVGLALDALPLTGAYCIAAGVAYVTGRRRIAAGAIALLAVVFAGIALAALSHRRPGEIHLLAVGPSVTLAGALFCLAAMLTAAGQRQHTVRGRRRTLLSRPTSSPDRATSTNPMAGPISDPAHTPAPAPAPSTTPSTTPSTMPSPMTNLSQGRPRMMEFR